MNRLAKCLKFELKRTTKSLLYSSAIFIGIYALITILATASIATTSGSNIHHNTTTMSFTLAFALFVFINILVSYAYHYNYLLMIGNCRKNILISQILTYIFTALALSLVVTLFEIGSELFLSAFNFQCVSSLNYVYPHSSLVSITIWRFGLFMIISFFAFLMSTLRYKFGRMFIRFFWIVFALIAVLFPMFNNELFANTFRYFFGLYYKNGIFLASGNFLILSAIFGIVSYCIGIRQELIVSEKR